VGWSTESSRSPRNGSATAIPRRGSVREGGYTGNTRTTRATLSRPKKEKEKEDSTIVGEQPAISGVREREGEGRRERERERRESVCTSAPASESVSGLCTYPCQQERGARVSGCAWMWMCEYVRMRVVGCVTGKGENKTENRKKNNNIRTAKSDWIKTITPILDEPVGVLPFSPHLPIPVPTTRAAIFAGSHIRALEAALNPWHARSSHPRHLTFRPTCPGCLARTPGAFFWASATRQVQLRKTSPPLWVRVCQPAKRVVLPRVHLPERDPHCRADFASPTAMPLALRPQLACPLFLLIPSLKFPPLTRSRVQLTFPPPMPRGKPDLRRQVLVLASPSSGYPLAGGSRPFFRRTSIGQAHAPEFCC
jgi:hypothetical protein